MDGYTLSLSICFYDSCINNVNSLFHYGSSLHEKLKIVNDKHVYLYDKKPTDEAKFKILILEIDAVSKGLEISISDSIFTISDSVTLKTYLKRALFQVVDFSNKCKEILQTYNNTDSTANPPSYHFYKRLDGLLTSNQKLIRNKLKILELPGTVEEIATNEVPNSFTLKSYNSKISNITDFLTGLKEHKFISPESDFQSFRKIFRNEVPKPLITWTGKLSELKFLIGYLHSKEIISNQSKHIWKITANCFVDKNGSTFDWRKFKNQKEPVKSILLSKIASHLQ